MRELGGVVLRLRGEGTSVTRDGIETTADRLEALLWRGFEGQSGDLHLDGLVAGVSGAGRPDERRQLEAALFERMKTSISVDRSAVVVVTDGTLALEAALGSESGVVIIAGTGSLALARQDDGSPQRTGGWGRLLGDGGGGYGLGRAALRAFARALDGDRPTGLSRDLAEALHVHDLNGLLRAVYTKNLVIQDLPVRVLLSAFEAGDREAARIVEGQIAELTGDLERLIGKLQADRLTHRIVVMGGLTRHGAYSRKLVEEFEAVFSGWEVEISTRDPVEGALAMADRMVNDAS